MSNFGFLELRLVQPYDLAFREAKSAVGATEVTQSAKVFETVAESVADASLVVGTTAASHRELQHPLRRLEMGAKLIRKHAGTVALLFGSEKYGLSNDDISHCHWLMQIPTRGEHRSMNLGQAVAVCLYELIRNAKFASTPTPSKKAAGSEQLEVLRERLDEALKISGYYNHTAIAGKENRLRALIKKLNLTPQDATIWLGIMRQILWKLNDQSK